METGLYYYGFRYYSSGIGKWVNRDIIDEINKDYLQQKFKDIISNNSIYFILNSNNETDIINLYRYLNNSSISFIDFLGLKVTIVIQRVTEWYQKSYTGTITVTSDLLKEKDDKFDGVTAEPYKGGPNKDKEPVDSGVYSAIIRYDHKPNRIELKDVKRYNNIQIHNGNNPATDSQGCFLVGTSLDGHKIKGRTSKPAMNKILSIIKKDCSNDIQVQINDIKKE